MVETLRFVRRNLPHWLVADRTYFVTMRVAGSLPVALVRKLLAEREALVDANCSDEGVWLNVRRQQFAQVETVLDAMDGNTCDWLTTGDVPQMILSAFDWLTSHKGWTIPAATVMPTHIHIVTRNRQGRSGDLLRDLARFKQFTARRANAILRRSGHFWAREEFDHWCRTPEKVEGAIRYVRNNPVKAGLVPRWQDWAWTVGE